MLTTTAQQPVSNSAAHRRLGGDRYRDQVISLVAEQGFTVSDSTREQDMKEASDLLLDGEGCALRIRAEKALQRWPDEFTIRAWRPVCGAAPVAASRAGRAAPGGAAQQVDTEFQKIMDGHARYALYGFTDSYDRVVLLRLLDLDVFRTCILGEPEKYDRIMLIGTDGVGYLVFNIREFPKALVRQVWDYRLQDYRH